MRLKVLVPTQVMVDEPVQKIVAEAENGSFCLLPRHIDFLAALVPGLLSFISESGTEAFLAVDEGILVKQGSEVLVSTRQAIRGGDLGRLRQTVTEEFEVLDDRERVYHSALVKLEANILRRLLELEA